MIYLISTIIWVFACILIGLSIIGIFLWTVIFWRKNERKK